MFLSILESFYKRSPESFCMMLCVLFVKIMPEPHWFKVVKCLVVYSLELPAPRKEYDN